MIEKMAPFMFLTLSLGAQANPTCPSGMRPVVGTHWENVQRLCQHSMFGHCIDFFPWIEVAEPRSQSISVCMDEFEWPNQKGQEPTVMVRFVEAEQMCASVGKRLCSEFEWELACEGQQQSPFPYGWKKEQNRCNVDKVYKSVSEQLLLSEISEVRNKEVQRVWQGATSGTFPDCISSYGVADLVGNVEEWVQTSRPEWPYRSSLKGGYWAKPWAGCRGTNDSHGPMFRFYEVGFRCCSDPQ